MQPAHSGAPMNNDLVTIETAATSASAVESANRRHLLAGLTFAVLTTIVAAFQPVVTRYGALNIDPLLYCAGSVTVAAASMMIVLWWRGELRPLVDRKYVARLVMLSMTGTVATSLLLVFGFHKIDAVAGVILLESEPVYSLILATICLGERPSRRQIAATFAILGGISSVFGTGHAFSPLYAAALIFVTPLFWQVSHVFSLGVMPPLTPACITGARYLFATAFLIVLLLCTDYRAAAELADSRTLATIGFSGLFVYCVGSLTWYAAINRLSLAWTTAFVIPGVPILSFLFAIAFLGEHPAALELVGVAVAMAGVVVLVLGAEAGRRLPAAAEAIHQPMA